MAKWASLMSNYRILLEYHKCILNSLSHITVRHNSRERERSMHLWVMFGSTFQLHVCVFLQQITGTHAPKRGNGSWTWRNATHERKTGNAK